ncbi:MAG: AAA domain-containing protein [Flammeovirgaceae bacterium]
MLQSIIHYFKDCYVADQRDLTLWSIFDKKVEALHLIEGEEELVNGALPKQFIPDEIAQKWLSTLQVYSKEKQLYYFSFLITGNTGVDLVGRKQICAPLVYYPAQLMQEEENYFLSIDFAKRQLNYPLIALLTTSEQKDNDYLETIFSNLPKHEITFEDCVMIEAALKPYLTQVNWDELYLYPRLADKTKLKAFQRKQQLHLLPSGAVGIVAGSRQTRGVLNELNELAAAKQEFSEPLQQLFQTPKPIEPNTPQRLNYVPAVLSESQYTALDNAQKYPLSMIVGPPGTGKSYTIAAMAVDCFSRGQTVLIASKMDHAVDVIAKKVEQQLNIEGLVVRAGRKNHLASLKKEIKLILTGNRRKVIGAKLKQQLESLATQTKEINDSAQQMAQQFEARVASEIERSGVLYKEEEASWFLTKWFNDYKKKRIRNRIQQEDKLWQVLHAVEAYAAQRHQVISDYLKVTNQYNAWRNAYTPGNRVHLNQFLKALRARTGVKQEALFNETNFDIILHTFPIWLVNLADLYDVLPLQKELFDVAIIDEATQCDIASCLPFMQRAKRVVVVGDPHQLRHVSFLSKARERILIKKNGLAESNVDWLDYRAKSILDLVDEQIAQQSSITFLDEHFRSLPDIIAYSNQAFYANELHVMSQNPINAKKQAVELIDCAGTRSSKGINKEEADFIFEKLDQLIQEEQLIGVDVCHKLGILSPFRDQVDYLSKRLIQNVAPEAIIKHEIQVGTAHSFQGEERDIMFISFVVDSKSPSGSFMHINKPDVFNVSITRARIKQYVLLSTPIDRLKQGTHLHNFITLIRQYQQEQATQAEPVLVYDDFLKAVIAALKAEGITCYPNYPLAGLSVDLVAEKGKHILGIDLIGWSETLGHAFSLERYQIINRAGLKIIPLPYTLWREQQANCLKVILEEFK